MIKILFLLVALLVSLNAALTYRKNNICSAGDHPIQSEAEAIKQAGIRFSRANYHRHEISGYFDGMPELVVWDQAIDCCKVTRTRNIFGVIVWEISLQGETEGETTTRRVDAVMSLSNCGAVFTDDSFLSASPINTSR